LIFPVLCTVLGFSALTQNLGTVWHSLVTYIFGNL
jgi:hypothetical protein